MSSLWTVLLALLYVGNAVQINRACGSGQIPINSTACAGITNVEIMSSVKFLVTKSTLPVSSCINVVTLGSYLICDDLIVTEKCQFYLAIHWKDVTDILEYASKKKCSIRWIYWGTDDEFQLANRLLSEKHLIDSFAFSYRRLQLSRTVADVFFIDGIDPNILVMLYPKLGIIFTQVSLRLEMSCTSLANDDTGRPKGWFAWILQYLVRSSNLLPSVVIPKRDHPNLRPQCFKGWYFLNLRLIR